MTSSGNSNRWCQVFSSIKSAMIDYTSDRTYYKSMYCHRRRFDRQITVLRHQLHGTRCDTSSIDSVPAPDAITRPFREYSFWNFFKISLSFTAIDCWVPSRFELQATWWDTPEQRWFTSYEFGRRCELRIILLSVAAGLYVLPVQTSSSFHEWRWPDHNIMLDVVLQPLVLLYGTFICRTISLRRHQISFSDNVLRIFYLK